MDSNSNNTKSIKKKVVDQLVEGYEFASQLQVLLSHQHSNHHIDQTRIVSGSGSVSTNPDPVAELLAKILGSFHKTISVLDSFDPVAVSVPIAVEGSWNASCGDDSTVPASCNGGDSGDSRKRRLGVGKGKRGCYTRKKRLHTRIVEARSSEDRYAWRKYGQKEILNTIFPRSYFRCTHKPTQGCNATKQVQKQEQNPDMFQITYIGYHTCTANDQTRAKMEPFDHEIIMDSDNTLAASTAQNHVNAKVQEEENNISSVTAVGAGVIKEEENNNSDHNKEYCEGSSTVSEVHKEVTMLFKGHEDLLMEFVNFLPNCPESVPSAKNAVPRHKGTATPAMHSDKKTKLRCKLEDYSEHSDQREDGDENIVACSAGNSLGNSLVKEGQPGYFQDEENREDTETDTADRTEKSAASGSKDIGNHKSTTKYVGTPINELDLSECTQCTPSYRLLPKDYAVEIPSYRNTLGRKTLNDHLVSVTSGSEDYSFSHMRKNQYEESLFRCEDDRYELDMLLGSVSSAIKHVENLLEKMNNNTISIDTTICIEKHLSAMNLRCIERLYGDNGLDVMDLLKKNMHSALPVILTRLKQKQEEWARCHSDFQKVWAEVYAKNHHKSLDHRSFYFKQQDSKNLSTKCLVAEIKDISEKKHQEDLLQAIAVRTMPSFTPDLEFNYCDTQIHEDLYLLIKYYCEEICASEQSDKVMKLWITFLEPMFGILSRSQGNLAMEDVSKLKTNQELHDACVAVKDSASGSNRKHPISPKLLNKDNPTMQGSSPGKDVSANIVKTALQDDAAMTNEVVQSSKLVSPRNDQIMEDVGNHMVDEASVEKHEVEREEGELSPTDSCEQGNFEVNGQNDLKPLQRVMDDIRGNKYQETWDKKGAYHTEMGAKKNAPTEDDKKENCHKISEDNETASQMLVSGTKFGCHEEHNRFMNCNGLGSVAGEVANGNEGEDGSFAYSEQFLQTVKPVAKHLSWPLQASETCSQNDYQVFYGNDSYYVLFRLHQMLYERIQTAKKHSEKKWKAPDNTTPDSYPRFMDALYNLLDGSSDNTKFEDECRAIFGAQSYVLFTLDKLVQKFVKHLHAVAADETDTKLLQLHAYENYRKPGRFFDLVYHENARALLHEANIYRIRYSTAETRLSIQLMNSGNNQPEVTGVAMEPGFADYLQNKYLKSADDEEKHGLFLKRNKEKFTGLDESWGMAVAMEGLNIINEMECKMACSSSKVKYVANTSDLLYRSKQGKQDPKGRLKKVSEISKQRRISRFHIMLNCRLCALPPLSTGVVVEVLNGKGS